MPYRPLPVMSNDIPAQSQEHVLVAGSPVGIVCRLNQLAEATGGVDVAGGGETVEVRRLARMELCGNASRCEVVDVHAEHLGGRDRSVYLKSFLGGLVFVLRH